MGIDFTFLNQIDPRVLSITITSLIVLFSVLVLFILIKVFFWIYLPIIRLKYINKFDYILLAIDIPKENYQSPKAVESIFSTLSGAYSGPTKKEKYIDGKVQLPFSFEIVSIDGYIQFLIRLPAVFRDLVEAALYSQYPNANITEVEDYVNSIPQTFPDETYKLWGSEIYPIKDDMYPIRTYPSFEHSLSQELKDPMSALLETMSRLGPGEQIWIQIVITPTLPDWEDRGGNLVKKLIGEKTKGKKTIAERLTDPILYFFDYLADTVVVQAEKNMENRGNEPINKMLSLSPGEKDVVAAIQNKLTKVGFFTKIRFIYTGEKQNFNMARGVSGFFGSFSQFNSLDLNGFKPHKRNITTAEYIFVKRRMARKQNRLLREYRERFGKVGGISRPFVLNIEELATIWHFPDILVKAPLVKKMDSKRAEPPSTLPSDQVTSEESLEDTSYTQTTKPAEEMTATQTDEKISDDFKLDLETTHFEERFAKDKQAVKERIEREAQEKANLETNKTDESKKTGSAPTNLPI